MGNHDSSLPYAAPPAVSMTTEDVKKPVLQKRTILSCCARSRLTTNEMLTQVKEGIVSLDVLASLAETGALGTSLTCFLEHELTIDELRVARFEERWGPVVPVSDSHRHLEWRHEQVSRLEGCEYKGASNEYLRAKCDRVLEYIDQTSSLSALASSDMRAAIKKAN